MTMTAPAGPRPRDLVCVIDHLHRDLGRADDARVGRFTHAGVRLDLGARPDWLHDGLADDEEWRIEWVKLYEGLDLAHAYAATGDRSYATAWEDLVVAFCAQVPVGHDSSDVSARRIQNWVYAWKRMVAATGPGADVLAPAAQDTIVARLRADVDHLRLHLTAERNHRTLELYALLVTALALPDALDVDGELSRFAFAELQANALTDIWTDGTHRECSTDYHHIVLRSFLGTIANARRVGTVLSDAFLVRVEAAVEWAMHVQRPDGTIPSFSDGDNGDFRDVLTMAADLFDRDDVRWVATGGREGSAPTITAATFPVGGYVAQRSGWGTERPYTAERFALLDCGPLGDGGHGHYDQLHVELVDGVHVLAVDPGRYTYTDGPWRHWFKGTAGHNTVTVDAADQTPYRRGKPKGPTSMASLVARHTCDLVDLVEATVESPSYDARHTRRLAFCAGTYWVVHDLLRAPTSHRYELRWHLATDALDHVRIEHIGGLAVVHTPHARFVLQGADEVVLEEGWVSEEYGVKVLAPVVRAQVTATDADLVTVVLPGDGGRVLYADADEHGCTVGVADVDAVTARLDVLVWPTRPTMLHAGRLWGAAAASWHRQEVDGTSTVRMHGLGGRDEWAGIR